MKRSPLKRYASLKPSRGKRRTAQAAITSLARGEPCEIRLAGICNGRPETTVPCHFRASGLSGFGYIPEALFVAHACSSCHAYADSHHDAATQLAFAIAVFRTQAKLLAAGVINVGRKPTAQEGHT